MNPRFRLRQGQVWQRGGEFLRIVRLERLEVEFKSTAGLALHRGTRHTLSKKEFCRLLKDAVLLPPSSTPAPPPD